jgi:hypothetical protein
VKDLDELIDGCCHDSAKIMRQCAVVAEVRGTPGVSLAKEIRRDVFGGLDEGLSGANSCLQRYDEEIGPETKAHLSMKFHDFCVGSITAWLRSVKELPEPLLDYGCARAFGNQVSLERQRIAWEAVSGTIARDLDAAIALVSALPLPQSRTEEGPLDTIQPSQPSTCGTGGLTITLFLVVSGVILAACWSGGAGGIGSLIFLLILFAVGLWVAHQEDKKTKTKRVAAVIQKAMAETTSAEIQEAKDQAARRKAHCQAEAKQEGGKRRKMSEAEWRNHYKQRAQKAAQAVAVEAGKQIAQASREIAETQAAEPKTLDPVTKPVPVEHTAPVQKPVPVRKPLSTLAYWVLAVWRCSSFL